MLTADLSCNHSLSIRPLLLFALGPFCRPPKLHSHIVIRSVRRIGVVREMNVPLANPFRSTFPDRLNASAAHCRTGRLANGPPRVKDEAIVALRWQSFMFVM